MPIMYLYPDGTSSPQEPTDGQIFYCYGPKGSVLGVYQYDAFIGSWYHISQGGPAKITLVPAEDQTIIVTKKCECGAEAVGSDRHSGWCHKHSNL